MTYFPRTRAMEGYRYPCKYFRVGCELIPNQSDKWDHEEMCDYRWSSCPYPVEKCHSQGRVIHVAQHLTEFHGLGLLHGDAVIFAAKGINTAGDYLWVMLQYCFDSHFMLVLSKRRGDQGVIRYYAVVQLLGYLLKAEHFKCRMELLGRGRHLVWEGQPRCIEDSASLPAKSTDCLIFDYGTAAVVAEDWTLGINVTIARR